MAKPLFSSKLQKRRDRDWSECRNHDALVHSKMATEAPPETDQVEEESVSQSQAGILDYPGILNRRGILDSSGVLDPSGVFDRATFPPSTTVNAQPRQKTKQKRKRRRQNAGESSLITGLETATEEETLLPTQLHPDAICLFVTAESTLRPRGTKFDKEVPLDEAPVDQLRDAACCHTSRAEVRQGG
jgi:hypothetical protein